MAPMDSSSSPSPWGKPGAWALDAEKHDAELQQQQQQQQQTEEPSQNDSAFPSLASAASAKLSKKKKKQQTLSLSEFNNSKSFTSPRVHDDVLNLPTGPRLRSPDEELDRNRLGGGFRSYGMGNLRGTRGDDSMSNSRGSRFLDRDGGRDRDYAPSRADEVDDWSKGKKSSFGNSFERRDRNGGGSFFDGQVSKADQSDNWAAGKVALEPCRFGAANNGGFERRGSFDSLSRERHLSGNGGGADLDSWGRKKEESNGTGGGVRPRLMLQPRTLPVSNENGDETVAKPKGSSPFGEARPREEVLAEKGKDWKETDEKLVSVKASHGKETESGDRRDSYGWRRDRSGFRSEVTSNERSWRKPDAVVDSRPQSAESAENGPALRNGDSSEDGLSETN